MPASITIDKSGANTAAACGLIADSGAAIELRQSKYLNNIVEQDHRAIKMQRLAARRPAVHRLMIEVQHLLKPRSAYRSPLLMAQLLLESLRR